MTPHKQLLRHNPAAGQIGDCWRTCIACLLDLAPDQVPHFVEPHLDDGPAATAFARRWLASRGFGLIQFAYTGALQGILDAQAAVNPDTYFLLGGMSRSGVLHSVIARNDAIEWDPHPDDVGVIGPDPNGLYWLEFLVPSLVIAPAQVGGAYA